MLNAEVINAASQFAYNGRPTSAEECKRGHINSTYFVSCESADGESYKYVLQAINTGVFKNPEHVMSNMVNVTKHIKRKLLETGEESRQKVIELIPLKTGGFIYRNGEGRVWRSYEYIVGENYQFAESPELLEFVGKAFGEFQMQLSDFDASKLYDTIPDFHNTPKRLADLELAVKKDECDRADSVREEIDFIFARRDKCSYIMDGIK